MISVRLRGTDLRPLAGCCWAAGAAAAGAVVGLAAAAAVGAAAGAAVGCAADDVGAPGAGAVVGAAGAALVHAWRSHAADGRTASPHARRRKTRRLTFRFESFVAACDSGSISNSPMSNLPSRFKRFNC